MNTNVFSHILNLHLLLAFWCPSLRKFSHTHGFSCQVPQLFLQPDFFMDFQT